MEALPQAERTRTAVRLSNVLRSVPNARAGETQSQEQLRPSVFEAARKNPAAFGDKRIARECYLADVEAFSWMNALVPQRQLFTQQAVVQASDGTMSKTLRVANWNINNLCGLYSNRDPTQNQYRPADYLAHVQRLRPDVIVMQETISDSSDYDDPEFAEACARVRHLEVLLEQEGYSMRKAECGNPTLLATLLPITRSEAFNLDDDHQWSATVSTTPGKLIRDASGVKRKVNESRGALYVQLSLGDMELGIYATHLHHQNYTATTEGVRSAEMDVILKHQHNHQHVAGLVVGDFNQPRKKDHSPDEWSCISGSSVDAGGVSERRLPDDDGVESRLHKHGFVACWDLDADRNYKGSTAPPLTHWSGITTDYMYLKSSMSQLRLTGNYCVFSPMSDHAAIVADIQIRTASSS